MSLASKLRRRQAPVPSLDGRVCLVTGAASGIGRATALAAGRAGGRLVLTDRNPEALDAVVQQAGGAAITHRALDISDFSAVTAFADDVHRAYGAVDVAMNIAGIATWGPVEKLSHDQWRRTVDVNLMGPIHVIECFVAEMVREGRGGQLVNVSSAAGLLGLPWHAPYSASKFGLRGVSEVLRFDLRRHRIGVTLVCPGGVDTPLVGTVDIAGVDPAAMRDSRLTDRFRRRAVSPDEVARRILDAVVHDRFLVYTSPDIRAIYLAERLVPPLYAYGMGIANRVFVGQLERAARSTSSRSGSN